MIPVTSFAGKKVAVFGLGGSGLVSASALLAGGADVVGWDDNAETVAKATGAGIPTADLRQIDWSRIAALVLAPGVPLTYPAPHWTVGLARAAAVEVIGDIELFCRERRRHAPDAPFVAITGTNGKSTTTALTAHLVGAAGYDAQMGGNIGTAILSLEPPGRGRVHVIEVSSYQVDLAPSLDPSVGILINVSEDHLDRHGTLAHYAAVKERLVAGVQAEGTAVVGVDDNWCQAAADRIDPDHVGAHLPHHETGIRRGDERRDLDDAHALQEIVHADAAPPGKAHLSRVMPASSLAIETGANSSANDPGAPFPALRPTAGASPGPALRRPRSARAARCPPG